ncbi:DEAD/DEAH box helicase [Algimonas porphyrae]|uniref:RNA helicase n=1 Tax=Algimonas porphyrae TaxID=1128113 RepID=A0ABQ5V1X7_9PROT|nr:DEAD/DEAH box helicase [Algimonas porphyrae]GLQ21481.1 RNA helicase [Algimonas porphyrae]
MTSFTDLDLAEPIARALATIGYTTPSPIQAQAIPHLLEGQDLLGIAQTGTGKTAAFALPTLHHIFTHDMDPPKRGARVLVLAPTRELVGQIEKSFRSYGRFMMDLEIAKVTGGVSIARQIKRLVHGNDILVATPGRLIDLLDRGDVRLSGVEVLILDEADQMMDMGFIHALRKIIPLLPKKRQTLFFSATLPPKIRKLADSFLSDPVKVTVSPPNTTAERVEQSLIYAEGPEKPMLLADSLLRDEVTRSLVFTRTKHGADRVVKRLAQIGIPALAIHGNRSQGQRTRALDAFKSGEVDVLVATDVAARGIDIPEISHVFNYEIPNVPEQYVHRIGRTARAQASGRAIAFVAKDERAYLKDIQKLLGETIPVETMPDDMADRIKVIEARPAIARVNLSPDQPARKGRGKSRKKTGKPSGKSTRRDQGQKSAQDRSTFKNASDTPSGERKPAHSKPKRGSRSDSPRTDGQGYRTRQTETETGKREPSTKTDRPQIDPARRRAAPSRKTGVPPQSGSSAPNAKSAQSFKRKPRRKPAPFRNRGGGQAPPKRRGH